MITDSESAKDFVVAFFAHVAADVALTSEGEKWLLRANDDGAVRELVQRAIDELVNGSDTEEPTLTTEEAEEIRVELVRRVPSFA